MKEKIPREIQNPVERNPFRERSLLFAFMCGKNAIEEPRIEPNTSILEIDQPIKLWTLVFQPG